MTAQVHTGAPAERGAPEIKLYVWDLIVRTTHWVTALSILLLALSGIYIGDPYLVVPGEAGFHFVMGTARAIHFYAAIAFTVSVLSRIVWMFLGSRRASWREFIPSDGERLRGILATVSFYLFFRASPPRSPGHNPLAGLTYVAVFGLYFVMIATGLGLWAVSADVGSLMRAFLPLVDIFGGPQGARWSHHVVMWLLIGFACHHFMSALLISLVKKNGTLESIFSGFKWVHPDEAKREVERWKRD